MHFPIAIEAYAMIEESDELKEDFLLERKVVYNQIEVDFFTKRHAENQITTKPLNAQELAELKLL